MKNPEERIRELEERVKFLSDRLSDTEGNIGRGAARFGRLEIVDAEDRVRVKLSAYNNRPRIVLFDECGKERITLQILGKAPILTIQDEDGKIRSAMTVMNKTAGLAMYDNRGECKVNINVGPDGKVISTGGPIKKTLFGK